MAFFSHRNDAFDLHDEVAALRKQMAALSRSVPKRGSAAWRETQAEASDLYDEIAERVSDALPAIRRGARGIEQTIRHNPVPVAAGIGLAALAVAAFVLVSSGGGSRR